MSNSKMVHLCSSGELYPHEEQNSHVGCSSRE